MTCALELTAIPESGDRRLRLVCDRHGFVAEWHAPMLTFAANVVLNAGLDHIGNWSDSTSQMWPLLR